LVHYVVPDNSDGTSEAGKRVGPGACLRMLGPARPVSWYAEHTPVLPGCAGEPAPTGPGHLRF
jgi:hypothetical protein